MVSALSRQDREPAFWCTFGSPKCRLALWKRKCISDFVHPVSQKAKGFTYKFDQNHQVLKRSEQIFPSRPLKRASKMRWFPVKRFKTGPKPRSFLACKPQNRELSHKTVVARYPPQIWYFVYGRGVKFSKNVVLFGSILSPFCWEIPNMYCVFA